MLDPSSSTSSSSSIHPSSSFTTLSLPLLEEAVIIPRFSLAQFLETYIIDYFSPLSAPFYVYFRGYIAALNGHHIHSTLLEWLTLPLIYFIIGYTSKIAICFWIYGKVTNQSYTQGIDQEVICCLLLDLFWRCISPLHFGFLTPREFNKYLTIPNSTSNPNHGLSLWLYFADFDIYSLEVKRSAARCTLHLSECVFEITGAQLSKLLERLGEGQSRETLLQGIEEIQSSSFSNSNPDSSESTNISSFPSSQSINDTGAASLPVTISSSFSSTPSSSIPNSPSINILHTYRLTVHAVCVAILLYAKRFSYSSNIRVVLLWHIRGLLALIMSISPIIARLTINSQYPIGDTLLSQFIILTCAIFNFLYSFVTTSSIIGGVEDFSRRSMTLRLLGELVSRTHLLPSTNLEAEIASKTLINNDVITTYRAIQDSGGSGSNAILPLESAGNVAAWLACRRILQGVGLQYVLQFGIYTVIAVSIAIIQFGVTLLILLFTTPRGKNVTDHNQSIPLPAVGQCVLFLVLYVGLLLFIIHEGIVANKTAEAHGELAVSLRAEAARKAALLRANANKRRNNKQNEKDIQIHQDLDYHESQHWDDVANLLEIVPKSLDFEKKLKVINLDATESLFNAVLSAIASGVGLVIGLLQWRFGAFT